jgi:hypothetical protein
LEGDDDRDLGGAYSNAYDAYRMAAEALLAVQGLRSTGGEGGHRNVEDAVSAQFANEIPAFAKRTFERVRSTRNTVQYFDPEQPDVSYEDAIWALAKADAAITGAQRIIDSGRLDPY